MKKKLLLLLTLLMLNTVFIQAMDLNLKLWSQSRKYYTAEDNKSYFEPRITVEMTPEDSNWTFGFENRYAIYDDKASQDQRQLLELFAFRNTQIGNLNLYPGITVRGAITDYQNSSKTADYVSPRPMFGWSYPINDSWSFGGWNEFKFYTRKYTTKYDDSGTKDKGHNKKGHEFELENGFTYKINNKNTLTIYLFLGDGDWSQDYKYQQVQLRFKYKYQFTDKFYMVPYLRLDLYNDAHSWNDNNDWGDHYKSKLYEIGFDFNYKITDTAALFGKLYYNSVYDYTGPWDAEKLATVELGFKMSF